MSKKIQFGLVVILAIIFGIYPITYLLTSIDNDDFLITKPLSVLSSSNWQYFFKIHIVASGIALFIGWMQFVNRIRLNKPIFHRYIGRIYFLAIAIGGLSGLYLAYYSNTTLSQSGFGILSVLWLYTAFKALYAIRQRRFDSHQKWATRSYAVTFSAVSFRICLTLLTSTIDNYELSFGISSWSCWIINLTVIELFLRTKRKPSMTQKGLRI